MTVQIFGGVLFGVAFRRWIDDDGDPRAAATLMALGILLVAIGVAP